MIEKNCEVQGHAFELTFTKEGSSTRMRVEALEPVDVVLARVIEAGAAVGIDALTGAVEARQGCQWDGQTGFAYPEEDDTIRPDFVAIHFRQERHEITEELFRAAVLQIARTYREVDAQPEID